MGLKEELIKEGLSMADTQVDHPFAKYPAYEVVRHKKTGKWFGLFMEIERRKLQLDGEGKVMILDVKAQPEMVSILQQSPGYLPAYHMNKQHWLTILLDGSLSLTQISQHLEDSYHLTK